MFAFSFRSAAFAVAVALAALLFTSCSGSVAARAGTPDSYWLQARQAYDSGDYLGAMEELDHLVDYRNEYTARAIPWSLVLSAGLASGYIELADDYLRGARANQANAAGMRRRASEYRGLASPLLLQAARGADRLDQLPPGSITLTFGRPRGSLVAGPILFKIAGGMPLTAEEAESAVAVALERNVLLSACMAVGAPNDSARAAAILSHASTITPRAAFTSGMAEMLERASVLYSRGELDYPDKLAAVQARVKTLRAVSGQVGPAMMVQVQASAR